MHFEFIQQLSGVQYGSANGGEAPIAPIPTYERSLTPLLQEHMDAGMCYVPNGYTPSFYYGGKLIPASRCMWFQELSSYL